MYAFHLFEILWDIPGPRTFSTFPGSHWKLKGLAPYFATGKLAFFEKPWKRPFTPSIIKVKFIFKAGRAVKPNIGRMVPYVERQNKQTYHFSFFSLLT